MRSRETRGRRGRISGTLGCFDRVLFRGYLPIMSGAAMATFLKSHQTKTCNRARSLGCSAVSMRTDSSPKSRARAAGGSPWPVAGPCPPRSSSGRSPTRHSSPLPPEVNATSSRKTKNLRTKNLRSGATAAPPAALPAFERVRKSGLDGLCARYTPSRFSCWRGTDRPAGAACCRRHRTHAT